MQALTQSDGSSSPARVLRALAQGIDPVTGEVVGDAGLLQSAVVIRALYEGAEALERQRPAETRERKATGPSRAGTPWSQAEDESLREAYVKGRTVKELAVEHERTDGAISSRLVRLGLIAPSAAEPPPSS
jgi:hypothetical protein